MKNFFLKLGRNLVFYALSTSAVISGRLDRENPTEKSIKASVV